MDDYKHCPYNRVTTKCPARDKDHKCTLPVFCQLRKDENASLKAAAETHGVEARDAALKFIGMCKTHDAEAKEMGFGEFTAKDASCKWCLEQRVKELEDEIQEDKDEFRRIVEDDRARDEIHCGCCVQLRMKVKEMEGLLDGLAWDDNVDHHDKDCQCGIHKARRFLEMLDTERGKTE